MKAGGWLVYRPGCYLLSSDSMSSAPRDGSVLRVSGIMRTGELPGIDTGNYLQYGVVAAPGRTQNRAAKA